MCNSLEFFEASPIPRLTVILTSLWQILFKGIDELRVASEPTTSLEMLLLRACHMSIMPSPDALIKSVLDSGSDSTMRLYSMEKKSVLKTPRKGEIIDNPQGDFENTKTGRSTESSDSSAVKEILDILKNYYFPPTLIIP